MNELKVKISKLETKRKIVILSETLAKLRMPNDTVKMTPRNGRGGLRVKIKISDSKYTALRAYKHQHLPHPPPPKPKKIEKEKVEKQAEANKSQEKNVENKNVESKNEEKIAKFTFKNIMSNFVVSRDNPQPIQPRKLLPPPQPPKWSILHFLKKTEKVAVPTHPLPSPTYSKMAEVQNKSKEITLRNVTLRKSTNIVTGKYSVSQERQEIGIGSDRKSIEMTGKPGETRGSKSSSVKSNILKFNQNSTNQTIHCFARGRP